MQTASRVFLSVRNSFLSYWGRFKRIYLRHKKLSIPLSIILAANFGLLLIIIFVVATKPPPILLETNNFKLEALSKDTTGIDVASEFLLKSEKPIEAKVLKASLSILPKQDYTLEKISETEYKIKLANELSKNEIYKFEIKAQEAGVEKTLSWAFQVKGTFRVLQTLPRDKANFVKTDTGIEVVFSHENFNFKGVKKYFSISPKVEGKFEKHKRTLVFIPNKLKPKTLYTVTVKKGISLTGSKEILTTDKIFKFETKSTDNDVKSKCCGFTALTYEFPATEKPVLEGTGGEIPGKIIVYKLDEAEFTKSLRENDKIPSWTSYQTKKYPTNNLSRLMTIDPIVKRTQFSQYFEIPEKLANGFYLVEGRSGNEIVDQAWLQITSISAYSALSNKETLFWVNSVATKKPIDGAKIKLIGGKLSTQTNKDGIAKVNGSSELSSGKFHYFKITSGNSTLIVRVGNTFSIERVGDQYWRYLYLDRGLYRTSDSISFWGLVKKREGRQPEKVKITLKQSLYVDYFYNPITILSKETVLSDLGTFTETLDFKNLNTGTYSAELSVNGKVIETKYIEIGIFDKPAYQIKVTSSKKAAFLGEKMLFKVKTEFFEGTSAPNINLKVVGDVQKNIKTNNNGEASFSAVVTNENSNPSTFNVYIIPNESEVGNISGSAGVQTFVSSLNIHAEGKIDKNQAQISGQIKNIDLSKIKELYSDDYLGTPASTNISVDILEITFTKTETGQYYDFIEKKVVKTYDYKENIFPVESRKIKSDSKGNFSLTFEADTEKSYRVRLSVTDSKGRKQIYTVYISRSIDSDSPIQYYLENAKDSPVDYKLGEEVELRFKKGQENLKPNNNLRFLYYQSQNGIIEHSTSSSPTYKFNFEEKHIPNIYVTGVFFNGFTYKSGSTPYSWWNSGSLIDYDESQKSLSIKIKPAKEKYNPGEKAKLEVEVTDRNGKAVSAEVNLNIIDESLYAISNESRYLDPLVNIYQIVPNGIIGTYLSHQYPAGSQGGGGGGGGGGRDDFRDKIYFGSVMTGKNGKASVEIDLPDNLTTWRVLGQAITKDLKVGKGSGNIVVSKDLFVEVNVPNEFLTEDKPEIKIRAFGSNLKSGDDVEFSIKVPTLGWKKEKKIKGKAFTATFIKLPKLKSGNHALLFSVKAKGSQDTLVKKIKVIDGRARTGKITETELKEGLKLTGGSGQNTLTFINEILGVTYPILRKQLWSFSDRLETKLSQQIASDLLKKHFKENHFVESVNFVRYQTRDGGLAIFPHADNDLELSAKVASYNANNFDKDGLRRYFLSILDGKNEGRERSIIALWGLASIGDPVLVHLENISNKTDLSLTEQLYAALAHIELGNKEKARSLFNNMLSKNSVEKAPYIYIKNKNKDTALQQTALAAMIGAKLQDKRATLLMRYIADEVPKETLIDLERVLASADYLSGFKSNEASFTINLKGKDEKIKLKGTPYRILVSASELKKVSFKDIKGKILVSTSYETSLNKGKVAKDPDLSIRRNYSVNNKTTTTIADGSLVKITINYDIKGPVKSGCYQVRDHLPSGLRAVTNPTLYVNEKDIWYVYQNTGQTISFCVRTGSGKPIKYFARVAAKGSYVAEPAIIQHQKVKSSLNFTSQSTIEIP